jgi:sulfoxide reductase catalytic subunit YedY
VFTNKQPATFWNDLQPKEYGFLSNVNPNIPHPRWTQASEKLLNNDERVPTMLFNGYGDWVAELYPDEPRTPGGPMAR